MLSRKYRKYVMLVCLWGGVPLLYFIWPSVTSGKSSSTSAAGVQVMAAMEAPIVEGDPKTNPRLLCVSFLGRLGNEIFEYTSTLGLALMQNRTPVFWDSTKLKHVLKDFREYPAHMTRSEVKERCDRGKKIDEESCCKFKKEMTQLDPRYDYRISKFLQSYRYFEGHEEEIRKAMTFNDNIQSKVKAIVKDLRQRFPNSTLVAMHIRHGDMATPTYQKVGYPVADAGYMDRAMSFFLKRFPTNCTFVVASDSPDWVRKNLPANRKDAIVHFLDSGNEPVVDMSVLASLDHAIMSFGSYSWWIGFLNPGGVKVYLRDFIRKGTFLGSTFNPQGKDYVYPGWIPL